MRGVIKTGLVKGTSVRVVDRGGGDENRGFYN